MPRFRKKPVVVEAEQFTSTYPDPPGVCRGECVRQDLSGAPHVHTLEGTSYTLEPWDWIIRGVRGEYYPCKPDVFDATYEECRDVPATAPDPDPSGWPPVELPVRFPGKRIGQLHHRHGDSTPCAACEILILRGHMQG